MSDPIHQQEALRLHGEMNPLYGSPPGLRGFLTSTNHTIIGIRFMVTAIGFFLIGGVLAMLIRAQLAGPGTQFLDAGQYAQVFTMHGTVMMFLFAIPLIEGFAMYLLPKMLGARDLAFPRLSAFGYWCYLFGGLILIGAMLLGVAPDSGWFMYVPLSSRPFSPGINSDVWLVGITVVEISAVCAAVEILATVVKMRAPGMALSKMPLLAWYLWVTAAMMLVGFPPLILGSILLEIERAFGLPFFDPTRGGDPLLWQHLFWLFGHPEVYIIFLPAAGIVSTLLPVFCGRPIVGYNWIVAALIAQAFISFGLWVHHMFATGIPHLSLAFFSAASLLVVVPTAIQIFAWLATMLKGRPRLTLPMLWIMGFFTVFVMGGLTGVMVAVVPFDWQAHDTHFIVAHLHYVLIGGFVFPAMAGLYYWTPMFSGRRSDGGVGRLAFWLVFIGFNLTFLVMHLTGLLGMPRRVFTYAGGLGWDVPNLVSSIGGFVMAGGFALVLIDMLVQWRFAPHAPRNPWKAGTLEWAMALPAPFYNFASLPRVASREPLRDDPDLPARLAAGEGWLAGLGTGNRETIGVDVVTGEPDQIVFLAGPSPVPLALALAVIGVALCFLAGLYAGAAVLAVAALLVALYWLWGTGLKSDPAPIPIAHGRTLPSSRRSAQSPAWWGMVFTLIFDGALFASLLFGYLFLWTIAPNWPPPAFIEPTPLLAAITLAALVLTGIAAGRAVAANGAGRDARAQAWFALAAGAGALATAGLAAVPALFAPPAGDHAYGALVFALSAYAALHMGLAAAGALFLLARVRAGFVSPARDLEPRNLAMFCNFAAVTGAIVIAAIHLMPLAGGG